MRRVIELAVIEACARHEWQLFALNVRLEHIHVVVGAHREGRETVAALKAYATRRLRDECLEPAGGKVWARGGSFSPLRDPQALCAAIDYVANRQGVLLPGSVFEAENL